MTTVKEFFAGVFALLMVTAMLFSGLCLIYGAATESGGWDGFQGLGRVMGFFFGGVAVLLGLGFITVIGQAVNHWSDE